MLYSLKQFFRQLLFANIYWIIAFSFFILIRFVAHGEEQGDSFIITTEGRPISEWIHYGVILGILIGTLYAIIEFVYGKLITKYVYLGITFITKVVLYIIVLIFSYTFIVSFIELDMNINLPNDRGWWIKSAIFWLATAYFFTASFFYLIIKLAKERFGLNIMLNLILGRYRKPREEERIFMFLDLKASTTIAENLGHYEYSRFIQDCFYDLNKIIKRYNAEIYQYVGDEVVLSWPINKGLRNNNCIKLFYAYIKVLDRRSKYYKKKYGIVPYFKAGIHCGKLIIAQVGIEKKELAFHGDVINTASRIQDLCNDYNSPLLASEALLNRLALKPFFKIHPKGSIELKGKEQTVNVFEITM